MNLEIEQVYQELSEKHRPQLESMRKPIAIKLTLAGLVAIAAMVFSLSFLFNEEDSFSLNSVVIIQIILFCATPIAFFWYASFVKRPYVSYFRENVAKSFVEKINPDLTYDPAPSGLNKGNILSLYHVAKFDGGVVDDDGPLFAKNYNYVARPMRPVDTMGFSGLGLTSLLSDFSSLGSPGLSNLITGDIERRPFQMCCMNLASSERDDKTKFKGLFVNMQVSKHLEGFIKIERKRMRVSISGNKGEFIPSNECQKMDSPAFEKDFLVGSNDQITAMRYLTADVMELLLDFKGELIDTQLRFNRDLLPQNPRNLSLDLFWQGDQVYMRIGNKKMFKPTLRNPMCKDSLACCLASLSFAMKFNHVITKSIQETAI